MHKSLGSVPSPTKKQKAHGGEHIATVQEDMTIRTLKKQGAVL
jgi:hypothetical protein